jgi:hypothetical protein
MTKHTKVTPIWIRDHPVVILYTLEHETSLVLGRCVRNQTKKFNNAVAFMHTRMNLELLPGAGPQIFRTFVLMLFSGS